MNVRASECSSGCESGWTAYLDQYSNSISNPYSMNYDQEKVANVNDVEEDEDLSMVSDASSGPPTLRENYVSDPQYYGYTSSVEQDTKKSKQKSKTKETKLKKQRSFWLDDTASSTMLHFSQENAVPPENNKSVDHFSQGFSSPHFEDKFISKNGLRFLKSKGKSGSLL